MAFSAFAFSESIMKLPTDLLESELNRTAETIEWVQKQKREMIRFELKRRFLANLPVGTSA